MGLSFRNDTREGLNLAFLMWDPGCWEDGVPFWVQTGTQFSAHGWYRIEPGRTQEVCAGHVATGTAGGAFTRSATPGGPGLVRTRWPCRGPRSNSATA